MGKTTAVSAPAMAPVMVLAGEDLFLRNEAMAEIRATVLGDQDPAMALVRFDDTAEMATVLDEIRTPSMFCPKKLVIVDPADKLLKGGGEEAAGRGQRPSLTNREILENYIESAAEGGGGAEVGVLVLVCESWPKTTRIHKALDKMGAIRWCLPIKAFQVPAWLTRRARDVHGKQLDPTAAARLAELIGPDLQRLDNELAKLALYQPSAPSITVAAVDALVGFQHEQQIWDMINALAERNAPVALKKIDEIWQLDPKIEYTAIGAVAMWLSQVLKARELTDAGMSEGEVIRVLKLWPPERANKVVALARRWGLPGAAKWSESLLAVDIANKTSLGESRLNLEKFVVALCAA